MSDTITLIGNISAEPEQRRTAQGALFTVFRLGVTARRYDQDKRQWADDSTSWYRVVAYRALGENAYASLHKGERVIVAGRLRVREWESGDRRGTSVELTATALGHDLLFGTTAFRHAERSAAPSPEVAPGSRGVDADGWAVPALDEQVPDEVPF